MSGEILPILQAAAGNPALLAFALFGATLIAEDLATIAAGVLVAQIDTPAAAALAAVILGTAAGDIALYAFGRWGAHTRTGKRLRARIDVRRAESWVRARALWLVFAARFTPGLRLPVFTASGLVRAPAAHVIAIVAFTTPIWTAALFETARIAGSRGAETLLTAILPLGLLIVLGGIFVRRRALAA